MRKIILITTLILISNAISFGQVDNDYAITLKNMFEISGTENVYKAVIKQMFTMFKQQYSNAETELWEDLEKEFIKTSLNDIVEMLAPIYRKYMTQDDLEAIIKFYKTPVGKKFAENTPLIMQESMQIGQEWGIKIGQEFEKKMKGKGY